MQGRFVQRIGDMPEAARQIEKIAVIQDAFPDRRGGGRLRGLAVIAQGIGAGGGKDLPAFAAGELQHKDFLRIPMHVEAFLGAPAGIEIGDAGAGERGFHGFREMGHGWRNFLQRIQDHGRALPQKRDQAAGIELERADRPVNIAAQIHHHPFLEHPQLRLGRRVPFQDVA